MSSVNRGWMVWVLALILGGTAAASVDPALPWDDEPDELSWEHFASCRHCFDQFAQWWEQLTPARREQARDAGQAAGLIAAQPETFEHIVIHPQAFEGDGWQHRSFQKRATIVGRAGHTRDQARYVLDVPEAGQYRLWLNWWNPVGEDGPRHNTITVQVRPIEVMDFAFRWQSSDRDPLFRYRFGFAQHQRNAQRPLDYPHEQAGFVWDAAPLWVTLPKGQVVIELSGAVHRGPYATRPVAGMILTQDPGFDPNQMGDAAMATIADAQPATIMDTPASQPESAWQVWCLRPATRPLHQVPRELADLWSQWRDGLIQRLAAGEPATPHEAFLVGAFYYDPQWNLVGTPDQVRRQVAQWEQDRQTAGGFWQWIEPEDFQISSGWSIAQQVSASGNRALLAHYTDGPAEAAARLNVARAGAYRVWVRYARIRGYYNHFDVAVKQQDQVVAAWEHRDVGPDDLGGGYTYTWQPLDVQLQPGQVSVVLTKNRGRSPHAYRYVDCVMVTDNLHWQPMDVRKPAWMSDHLEIPAVQQARETGRPIAWLDQADSHWNGFTMSTWPEADSHYIDDRPIPVVMHPESVQTRLVHLTNPHDTPITITPTVSGDAAGWLQWRVMAYQLSKRYGWQPSALLKRHHVTIPPGLTVSLWLTFDSRGHNAKQPGELVLQLGDQPVRFAVELQGPSLAQSPHPLVGGWCSPHPTQAGWQQFADIGLGILHRMAVSRQVMQTYGIRLQVLALGVPETDADVHEAVAALEQMGLGYQDWAWQLFDEPGDKSYERWVQGAMKVRQADPNIRIWCNPGERQGAGAQAVLAMMPHVDVFCPYINHFGSKDEQLLAALPDAGQVKLVYWTPCFTELSPGGPNTLLNMAPQAHQHGRDGWNMFSLRNYYEYNNTAWDDVNAYVADQAVSIYPGAFGRAIGSRNLEAVRQSIQNWKLSHLTPPSGAHDSPR